MVPLTTMSFLIMYGFRLRYVSVETFPVHQLWYSFEGNTADNGRCLVLRYQVSPVWAAGPSRSISCEMTLLKKLLGILPVKAGSLVP